MKSTIKRTNFDKAIQAEMNAWLKRNGTGSGSKNTGKDHERGDE